MYFHALNFRTSQAVRKYFNNKIFAIYGIPFSIFKFGHALLYGLIHDLGIFVPMDKSIIPPGLGISVLQSSKCVLLYYSYQCLLILSAKLCERMCTVITFNIINILWHTWVLLARFSNPHFQEAGGVESQETGQRFMTATCVKSLKGRKIVGERD